MSRKTMLILLFSPAGILLIKYFFVFILSFPSHVLQKCKCFRTEDRFVTIGNFPFRATFGPILLYTLLTGVLIRSDSVENKYVVPLYFFLVILALVTISLEQNLWIAYPKLYIEDKTLYMKGFFIKKVIPFDELQKGRRLMKPFIYNKKVYIKLEQGSISMTPTEYIGGFDFLECLFAELGWEPVELYKEKHIWGMFQMYPPMFEYSQEAKALYEMLEKEQEMLRQEQKALNGKNRFKKKKLPGIWPKKRN